MKKKLLSLLLVLCMVIPMVPMTVLAAGTTVIFYDVDGGVLESVSANYGDLVECPAYTVEGETFLGWDVNGDGTADYSPVGTIVVQNGYTTVKPVVWVAPDEGHVPVDGEVSAFFSNAPVINEGQVVYNGNWTLGYMNGSTFAPYNKVLTPAHVDNTHQGLTNQDYSDLWAVGGMYYNTNPSAATRYYTQAVPDGKTTALEYAFNRDASIKIDFNNVTVMREGGSGTKHIEMDFAIYKNDTLVWPVGEADVDGDGWYTYDCDCDHSDKYSNHVNSSLVEDLPVSVEAGDTITFRARRTPNNGTVWMLRWNPSIEFVDVDENTAPDTTVTTTSFGANMPTYDQNVALIGDYIYARGNWSMVNRDTTDWSNVKLLQVIEWLDGTFANNKGQSAASKGTQVCLFPEGVSNMNAFWSSPVPVSATQNNFGNNPGTWGALYGLNPAAAWNTGIRYVAEYTSNVSIDITKLIGSNATAGKVYAGIFVDGTMVWPNINGSYTDVSEWFEITGGDKLADAKVSEGYAKLANIYVVKGASIELLLKNNNVGAWSTMGSAADMTVTYKEFAGANEVVVLNYDSGSLTLPAYTGEGAFLGWDADGDGDVDYMDEETITMPGEVLLLNPVLAGSTSFGGNKPDSTADNSVVYNGGWKVGAYDKGAGKFIPFNYGQSADIRFSFNNKYWADNNILSMYDDGRFALSDEVMLDGRYQAAVQYTAEMSGNITIDFATLELQRSAKAWDVGGPVSGGFAIYHNGVKIAPVDADYYYYESEKIYAMGESGNDGDALLAMFHADDELTVDVKKGDTIEVRGFKNEVSSRMFIIDPMISYNEVPSKPIVTGGGVTVGQVPLRTGMYVDMVNGVQEIVRPEDAVIVEGFTLDIYASLNAPRTDFMPEDFENGVLNIPYGVMLVYWSEKKDEMGLLPATWYQNNTKEGDFFSDIDFRFQLPAIKAEDISTNYLVCPIIIYADGSSYPNIKAYNDFKTYNDFKDFVDSAGENFMNSEGENFSVSKYASLVLESPEMDNDAKLAAGALLNYAAAINAYFENEDSMFVMPDEMPVLPSITPEDVYNLTEFDGDAKISGATLVIEETISMRIYVDSTANISGWALQMDEDASFETPRNLKDLVLKRNTKGKYYVVDVEIPTVNFGDAFYFRVVDQNGDQQSGVLTYSVESYVARMQGTGSAELLNLLDAMLTLCKVSNDVA